MAIKRNLVGLKFFCRYLGITPSLSSITDRILLQKIFYFLKKFDLELPYNFNFYKHGPYSPYLTDIYYQLDNYSEIVRDDSYTISEAERKKLDLAKDFLDPFKNDVDKLEYYASLLYIFTDMFFFESAERIDSARRNKIRTLKPQLIEKYGIDEPISRLRNFNLIN